MAFESLRPHADLILRHAPPHGRLSDLVTLLRQRHGVTTTAGTLSKFISELRLSSLQPFPRATGTPPPPLPPQVPQPSPPIDVNLLMGDVLAELEGTRVEIREHMAKLAGKAAVIDAEVQEMGKAVEELVDIGTRPPDPVAPTVQWGASRETVKRIWQSALFITATAWLAVLMLVSWRMPEVASAFLTQLGVQPEKVVHTVTVPGPERVTVQRVEVPVLGPERVKIERVEVKVPGPERVVTKVERVEVPTPGPVRVETRVEKVEVPGQCAAHPLYSVPDTRETEKLDAACDALASARSSGITPARKMATVPETPPPPQTKLVLPSTPPATGASSVDLPKGEDADSPEAARARDESLILNFCEALKTLTGELNLYESIYGDFPEIFRGKLTKDDIIVIVRSNYSCNEIINISKKSKTNDQANEKYRHSNRGKDRRPLPLTAKISADDVASMELVCLAVNLYNMQSSRKISMWACNEISALRQFSMLPSKNVQPSVSTKPPSSSPPSSEPPASANHSDVQAWQSDKLSIDERHRNNDILYNLCVSVQENTANGLLPPVAHLLDFPTDHRWNGRIAGPGMSFAIGSIKLQCTPERMMANRIYDVSERARAQRPDRRAKTVPPIPPTTNNDIIQGLATVCGFLDSANRSKFKNAWLCDQMDEWRRYGMLPKAP